MDTISVNKFRDNMKNVVDEVITRHKPLKVKRRAGDAFVVISADDWEREQERECKKICVSGILSMYLKGMKNASIRPAYRPVIS